MGLFQFNAAHVKSTISDFFGARQIFAAAMIEMMERDKQKKLARSIFDRKTFCTWPYFPKRAQNMGLVVMAPGASL